MASEVLILTPTPQLAATVNGQIRIQALQGQGHFLFAVSDTEVEPTGDVWLPVNEYDDLLHYEEDGYLYLKANGETKVVKR